MPFYPELPKMSIVKQKSLTINGSAANYDNNMSDQVLTGIKEEATGFVGSRGLKVDETKNGKARVRFDVGCGVKDESQNKYATWRHCIAYGTLAEKLKGIKSGSWIKVIGWVATEGKLDEYFKPIRTKDGRVETVETLICHNVFISDHTKLQSTLPLEVGQAS